MLRPALFLDRDGVVIKETGSYVWQKSKAILEPDLQRFLFAMQNFFSIIVVITNQGGVAKHLYSKRQVEYLHEDLMERAEVAFHPFEVHWYFCPHHPSVGACFCRKPDNLHFQRSIYTHGIDPHTSVMIGDQVRDMIPARRMGMYTLLISESKIDDPSVNLSVTSLSEAQIHLQQRLAFDFGSQLT